MKTRLLLALVVTALMISCSKDDDSVPKSKLSHVGEKWKISSVTYTIVDQSLTNPANWIQNSSATNAGYFYFNGDDGSFDILINNKRQEDYFGYTSDGSSVNIVTVDQNLSGTRFSQSVIAISGDRTSSSMTLSGTFTRQSTAGQYVFTGSFELVKQ